MADNHFKINRGLTFFPQASAPSNPSNGDMYYDSTLGFQKYENGAWGALGGGGAGVTYTATGGETIAANTPVYISEGGSVDSGRTAGKIYKLEVTNSARSKYAGFTTEAFTLDSTGDVQIGGELSGFSGLTPGATYWASVTTPGNTQASEPTTVGQKKVPVMIATSATTAILEASPASTDGLVSAEHKPVNFINNWNAEADTTDWAAFADSASSLPTDMTGGSPTITLSRTTTAGEVLNGSGSFKVVKGASNCQGQGVSVSANVPVGYRTSNLSIKIPFKVLSGSLVQGDLKLFVYDVTNSQVITPFNNDVIGSQGVAIATFAVSSTTAQIRVGFYFASTSASALTFSFDDVYAGPAEVATGPAMTDWIGYTPSFQGFGTPSNISFFYRRVGGCIEIQGRFTTGTKTATEARIYLPSGITLDSTVYPSLRYAGRFISDATTPVQVYELNGQGGNNFLTMGQILDGNSGLQKRNGDTFVGTDFVVATVQLAVSGWSSNVTMAQSSTFRVSQYLANGSRVTGSAPTRLGEYRSYLRDSAGNYSETNGTPANPPSAADGIRIYCPGNGNNASNDPSGEPSRYEIFVGKNKHVSYEWYKNAGRTGTFDPTHFVIHDTNITIGIIKHYDPTTGIVSLIVPANYPSIRVGTDPSTGGGIAVGNDAYFDIIVSENALAVGVQSPRSEFYAYGGAYSASATYIPYFTTVDTNNGTAFSVDNNSSTGLAVTILEDGLYAIHGVWGYSGSNTYNEVALTKNYYHATNTSLNVPYTNIIMIHGNHPAAGSGGHAALPGVTGITFLRAGDVVRMHLSGNFGLGGFAPANNTMFRIVKINN